MLSQIKRNLLKDISQAIKDSIEDRCDVPTVKVQESCLSIGLDFVSKIMHCSYMVFGEDDGGLDLIVDNVILNRRVTLRFNKDGKLYSVISVDEFLNLNKAYLENISLNAYAEWMNDE